RIRSGSHEGLKRWQVCGVRYGDRWGLGIGNWEWRRGGYQEIRILGDWGQRTGTVLSLISR
ncbi:MAG: hypothetical protein P9L88_08930, partial [Candidatus Tantalella remota]|nr:hypothetical protein [Candidatus Tantalella remota]